MRPRAIDWPMIGTRSWVSMAISVHLLTQWRQLGTAYRDQQKIASDISGGFGISGRILRMMLQSAVLAVGAYLVIHQEASGGIIIASSILTGRPSRLWTSPSAIEKTSSPRARAGFASRSSWLYCPLPRFSRRCQLQRRRSSWRNCP